MDITMDKKHSLTGFKRIYRTEERKASSNYSSGYSDHFPVYLCLVQELFLAQSTLYNEDGKGITFGTNNFSKSKIPLTEEIGYE